MKLYKFKSLKNESFSHTLDMIVNDQIYLPTNDGMNDPFEGVWENPKASIEIMLKDDTWIKFEKLKKIIASIRFTCFTDDFKNALFWAHYAGGFSGVCFEYQLSEEKYDIRKIDYGSAAGPSVSFKQIDAVIKGEALPQDIGILKTKAEYWSYESECRLYQPIDTQDEYIYERPTKIIFGHKNFKFNDTVETIAKKFGHSVDYLYVQGGQLTLVNN